MSTPAPQPDNLLPESVIPRMAKGVTAAVSHYTVRQILSGDELKVAQSLRFQVFNLELKEGLASSFETGLDIDEFDPVCDHLLVENKDSGEVVGTYRMQTGASAGENLGFYSAREFDFAPFEKVRQEVVEVGRACVHRDHRNFAVLNLLWKGIARYANEHGCRYLLGCSSLTSQDPVEGAALYRNLEKHLPEESFRTDPLPGFRCPLDQVAVPAPKAPKLLTAYLMIGAKICGPPAIDREFKTIDFLTFLDLKSMPARVAERFLG